MKNLLANYNLDLQQSEKMEGYASINYKLKTATGTFVLKHYQNPEDYPLIHAEDTLLKEIAQDLLFETPKTISPLKKLEDQSFTRLLNYIDGDLLGSVKPSDTLLYKFGQSIGLLSKALKGKRNLPIEARKHEWDLQHCLLNRPKLSHITTASNKKLVDYFFDLYENEVRPKQDFLRYAIIHGDLNENNVLVENDTIKGFIDFGDICYAPVINEIAIALTYIMLLYPEDPLQKASEVLKGYHAVFPLLKEEIELLYYLIPARLCVSVCNSSELASKGKASDYILINQKPAWRLLNKYISFNPIGVCNHFLTALKMKITTPNTAVIEEKRSHYLSKALSLSYEQPIHMTGAAFQYMYDQNGNSYLDAYNNIPLVGHCHPKISQVISKKIRKLNTNTRYLYEELSEYSEKLLSHFPSSLNKVFFVNSGSAASDLATRLARNYTQRNSFAVLEHGYHGNTNTAIELSAYKFDGKGGKGLSQGTIKLPLPNLFRGLFSASEAYTSHAQQLLQEAIDNSNTPAALMAEPISGCGGQVPLAPGYLQKIKPFLEQHDILMISDEVQTGFGRLGSHFWGFEMHQVIPDIVILGKPMGNSHPIGAVVTSQKIADAFANGMEFFSSFGGNPVSCAVGHTVLQIIEEEKLQENALIVGSYYKEELQKLKSEFPCIGDVRGQGLFLGFELLNTNGKPATELANNLKNKLKEDFILLSTDGPFNNIIKTKPPLCFNKENVDQVILSLKKNLLQLKNK